MEDYREAEQNLLMGVLDALPYPLALLNREGAPAYVNPRGEACRPSLYECGLEELPIVRGCLAGESVTGGWVTLPGGGVSLSGLAEVYAVRAGETTVGALFLLRPDIPRAGRYDSLPYVSEAMAECRRRLERLHLLGVPALLLGEEGTGRASFARALHTMQNARDVPFTEIDCRRPEIERILFGEAGALRVMSAGSLFLHCVEGLPLPVQRRLADVIKNRSLEDGALVGVRFMASGPSDLASWTGDRFDRGLYARIAVMPLCLPALRDRPEDILPLAGWFLKNAAQNYAAIPALSEGAQRALLSFPWPGNLRQLEETVVTAMENCGGGVIEARHLPIELVSGSESLQHMRLDFNRRRIEAALAVYGHTVEGKRMAARELGIGLSTLYRLLAKDE